MFHIILNPVAGKKKAQNNFCAVEKVLKERGIPYEAHQSKAIGDAKRIAEELTKNGATDLIVLGGDGTLHEVLNGLLDPSVCRLGLIPSGTGNDFAGKIGMPMDAEQAILKILESEARPTDYLQVGDIRCMNVAGLGIDVDVLERCHRGKMKGKPKYVLSLLCSLLCFKGYKVTVEVNGETFTRQTLLAAACNGAQLGGGIPICPVAEVDDGKLDVIVVDCLGGIFKIIRAFMFLMKGGILEYPAAKHYVCERVRFTCEDTDASQSDGEVYKGVELDIQIRTGLKFYR